MSKQKVKNLIGTIIRIIILVCFFLSATLPLFWIFVTSIKNGTELYVCGLHCCCSHNSVHEASLLLCIEHYLIYSHFFSTQRVPTASIQTSL